MGGQLKGNDSIEVPVTNSHKNLEMIFFTCSSLTKSLRKEKYEK